MVLSNKPLLDGELVRLRSYTKADHNVLNPAYSTVEILRLASGRPAYPNPDSPASWEWIEGMRKNKRAFPFAIETLADQTLIGDIDLKFVDFGMRHAELGVGIADPANRGKGYGTDAIKVILGYGFRELNLNRIQLMVNSYNEPAVHVYQKLGFTLEATLRENIYHDLKYYDVYIMGMLEPEWRSRYWDVE